MKRRERGKVDKIHLRKYRGGSQFMTFCLNLRKFLQVCRNLRTFVAVPENLRFTHLGAKKNCESWVPSQKKEFPAMFSPWISCHYHPRQPTEWTGFPAFLFQLQLSERRIWFHKSGQIATWLEQSRLILLTIFSARLRRVVLPHPGGEYITTVG